jgi:serine/threonine-protein kinase
MSTGKVIVIAALTSALVSAGTFFGLRHLSPGGGAFVVPPLSGLRVDQARQLLENQELLMVVSSRKEHAEIPAEHVISQVPGEGSKVKSGAQVSVVVSSGLVVEVPALAGKPLARATQALNSAGLKVGEVTREASPEVPEGQVIRSSPAAGEQLSKDAAVALVVSQGPAEVAVPKVLYKGLNQARELLEKAGLKVGKVTRAYNDDVRPRVVLRQEPEAEEKAPKGTEVNLILNGD